MNDSTHAGSLVPGSLPSRVLAEMLTSNAECTAEEMAEQMKADVGEVRQAFGTLRKLAKVLQRNEDNRPVYRLPSAEGTRIPGSSLQVIPSPLEMRREVKAPRDSKPATKETPNTPKEPAMKEKHPARPGSERAKVLECIKANPGITSERLSQLLGITKLRAQQQIVQLNLKKLISRPDSEKPYKWTATPLAGAPDLRDLTSIDNTDVQPPLADVSTAKAKKKRAAKPRGKKLVLEATPNLAAYGAGTPAKPVAVGVIENPALAIDADGVVAIEDVKLSPKGIHCLVGFLEKTQHVWKGAPA